MVLKKKRLIIFIGTALIITALAVVLFAMLQEDEMPEDDFSELTWTEAFVKLNETMSRQYAFTEWNDRPITSAVEAVSTLFATNSATGEVLKQKQLAYLARAPLGTDVKLTLSDSRSVVLTAYADQKLSIKKNYPFTVVSEDKLMVLRDMIYGIENSDPELDGAVEMEMMDGNILYVKLWGLIDLDPKQTGKPVSTLGLMREAVAYANENQCAGMILDIRNNVGGITVNYPFGQSLDKDKHIQLDSQNEIGGVSPSIRIHVTKEKALRIANGEDVELEEALRILTKHE